MNETRTDKDYAIEFGEYLAKAAEDFMEVIIELNDCSIDNDYIDELNDRYAILKSAIYEFRKRKERCLSS